MKIRRNVAVIVALMLIPALSAAKDVVLISNASVKTAALSKKDVIKIFLGKKIAWDDETRIIIVLQNSPEVRNAFLKKYIHKSTSMFANLWRRKIFTGEVTSPKYVKNDQEMIEYVSETKGAIGYVSTVTGLKNVKTILVK